MALTDIETPTPLADAAIVVQVCIEEALEALVGLAPHPSRTLLGCHLLAAREVALGWRETNEYEADETASD